MGEIIRAIRQKLDEHSKTPFAKIEGNWYSVSFQSQERAILRKLPEAATADAILDKIVHDSYTIEIRDADNRNQESMREVYGVGSKCGLICSWEKADNRHSNHTQHLQPPCSVHAMGMRNSSGKNSISHRLEHLL